MPSQLSFLFWSIAVLCFTMGIWQIASGVLDARLRGSRVQGWLGMLLGLIALLFSSLLVILLTV